MRLDTRFCPYLEEDDITSFHLSVLLTTCPSVLSVGFGLLSHSTGHARSQNLGFLVTSVVNCDMPMQRCHSRLGQSACNVNRGRSRYEHCIHSSLSVLFEQGTAEFLRSRSLRPCARCLYIYTTPFGQNQQLYPNSTQRLHHSPHLSILSFISQWIILLL